MIDSVNYINIAVSPELCSAHYETDPEISVEQSSLEMFLNHRFSLHMFLEESTTGHPLR